MNDQMEPTVNSLAARGTAAGAREVRLLEAGEEDQWDRFVLSSPAGTLFHLTTWSRIIEAECGHRCFRLIARNEQGISGVFPIALVRNRFFGDSLVSLPLAVYGGICSNDELSYFSLLRAGTDLATRLGVQYLELRNRSDCFPTSLPRKDLYVTFTQDLSVGPEALLRGLPRDTRYMIRKSLSKLDLAWAEDLTMEEFYEVYARSVHRLGTPVFSKTLFSRLLRDFPTQSRIFGVRKGNLVIAAVLCFYFKDQVIPYYGGSLAEFNKDAPNNFMYWNLIAQSCREGWRSFDFGRSKRGTGAFTFKSAWSMRMTELPYRYYLCNAKRIPQFSPVDKQFRLPVEAWKRLPFAWTKVLGPRVIQWIPSI